MEGFRKFLCILLTVCLLGVTVWNTVDALYREGNGGVSDLCHMTEEDRQWIREQFGACEDFPTLFRALTAYAEENFMYDTDMVGQKYRQFRFRTLLETGRGVCYHFSAFTKCCVLEWAQMHGLEVENYVVVVNLDWDPDRCHSYNYVISEGTLYAYDMTPAAVSGGLWFKTYTGSTREDIRRAVEQGNEEFLEFQ